MVLILVFLGLGIEESSKTITHNNPHQLVHPDDFPKMCEEWQHSLETGEMYKVEQRLRRADGTYRWTLTRGMKSSQKSLLLVSYKIFFSVACIQSSTWTDC